MKLLLAALCVVLSKVAVDGQLIVALAKGHRVSLGPLDVNLVQGVLPPKYPVQSGTDITVAKNLVAYIENQRQYFEVGNSHLPVLEPYHKNEIEAFNVDGGLITGRVALKDVNLSGLKGFYLSNVEARVNGYRVDFNVSFPVLNADVDYTADTVLSGLYPLSFAGHVSGRVSNLHVGGAARIDAVKYLDKTVFQVKAYHVRATATNIEGQVSGLNLGEAAPVLDDGHSGVNNPVIVVVKQKVAEAIGKIVTQEVNEYLLNFSASQVLKYLYYGKPARH